MLASILRATLFTAIVTSCCYGQFWEKPGGPYSGTVQSIHVLDDGTVLAGTPRGLFARSPGNEDWTKLESPAAAVSEIISVDEILYAATRAGIFSSPDDVTWSPAGLPDVRVLSLLKHSSGALYAGTFRDGVFTQAPGDSTWMAVTSGLPHFYNRPDVFHPIRSLAEGASGVIFAGTGPDDMLEVGAGVCMTENGGSDWKSTGAPSVGDIGKVLADEEGLVLAAGFRTYWQLEPGIVRSTDNGRTWSRRSGIDAASLHRAPDGTLFAATAAGVLRSTNGGLSWGETGLTGQLIASVGSSPAGTLYAGSGHHCYHTIDPPSDCLYANGLFTSDDGGESWYQAGIEPAILTDLLFVSEDTLWAATETGVLQSANRGDTWTSLVTARHPIFDLYVDSTGAIYAGTEQYGIVPLRGRDRNEFHFSVLGSVTAMLNRPDSLWIAGVADCVYCEAPGLHRVREGVFQPSLAEQIDPGTEVVSILQVGDGTLLAATRGGFRGWHETDGHGILRSDDESMTWHSANDGLPEGDIHDLLIDVNGRVFAATGEGVYRLLDDVFAWEVTALDAGEVQSLMNAEDGLLAMRGDGLFGLRAAGEYVKQVAPFDASEQVRFAVADSGGHIYVAAQSGLFRSTAPVIVSGGQAAELPRSFQIVSAYPNPFSSRTTIDYTLNAAGHVSLTVHDLLGREVAVLESRARHAGRYFATWYADHYPAGVYVIRLEAGGRVAVAKVVVAR